MRHILLLPQVEKPIRYCAKAAYDAPLLPRLFMNGPGYADRVCRAEPSGRTRACHCQSAGIWVAAFRPCHKSAL